MGLIDINDRCSEGLDTPRHGPYPSSKDGGFWGNFGMTKLTQKFTRICSFKDFNQIEGKQEI